MAKKQALPAEVRDLVERTAEKVLDATYGAGGSPPLGVRFEDVEDAGVEVGDSLARAVMQLAMERQAATIPAESCHCSCGSPTIPGDPEPRAMTTRRGEIGWNEPLVHCPPCRRAFFPSGPRTGPASG